MATEAPSVSLVVAARNEAATIEGCVAALQAQEYPGDLEILVVDGYSTDATAERVEAIAARDRRVRLLRNPARITPIAFNIGLRAARGEILGIMSGHAEAAPDYVTRCVSGLAESGAWAIGGRIERLALTPIQQAIAAVTSSPFGVGNAVHNYGRTAQAVETAFPGMWPRDVLEHVGLFDEELVRNQDDELSYRIRAAGGTIRFDPAIVVAYHTRDSWTGLFRQFRDYAMWKVRVFQKHRGAVRPRHLVPPMFIAALAGGSLLAPLIPAGGLVALAALVPYGVLVVIATARLRRAGTTGWLAARALVTLHLAYGVGFWQGIVRFAPRWLARAPAQIGRLDRVDQAELQAVNGRPSDIAGTATAAHRAAALDRTVRAYREYRESGRDVRWSEKSPGMRIAIADRDEWVRRAIDGGPHGTIVDVGCGDGDLGVMLGRAGMLDLDLVGIDIVDERLERARSRVPWASFRNAAADAIPVGDREASAVVALTLLSSVTDTWMRDRVYREIDRVLAPQGRLIVYDMRYPSPTNPHVRRVTLEELRRAFPGWGIAQRTMTVLPPIARSRVAGGDRRYRAIHAIPLLRSHVSIVATKPG